MQHLPRADALAEAEMHVWLVQTHVRHRHALVRDNLAVHLCHLQNPRQTDIFVSDRCDVVDLVLGIAADSAAVQRIRATLCIAIGEKIRRIVSTGRAGDAPDIEVPRGTVVVNLLEDVEELLLLGREFTDGRVLVLRLEAGLGLMAPKLREVIEDRVTVRWKVELRNGSPRRR